MAKEQASKDLVAGGITFRDGSVMMFSEMEPPIAGSVLVYGGSQENSGFMLPTDTDLIYEGPDTDKELAPSPPTAIGLSYTIQADVEGIEKTATLHVTWTAPTTEEDDNQLVDLDHCRVEYSPDDVTYTPAEEVRPNMPQESYIPGLATGQTWYVRVIAVDLDFNESVPGENSIAVTTTPPPGSITNVTVAAKLGAILVGSWDAVSDPALWGYIVQLAQSTNAYSSGGSPSGWNAWSSDYSYPSGSGRAISWQVTPPTVGYWYKIRVKGVWYGNVVSTSWTESSSYAAIPGVQVSGLDPGVLNAEIAELVGSGAVYIDTSGMVCKNSKFIFYSNDGVAGTSVLKMGNVGGVPMVAAYDSAGHKACLGTYDGNFWGLYIESGMIDISTASDKVTIDSTGIKGYVGTEIDPRFDLTSAGLTLRKSNILLTEGGAIDLQGSAEESSVRLDLNGLIVRDATGTIVGTVSSTDISFSSVAEAIADSYNQSAVFDFYVPLANLTITEYEKAALHKRVLQAQNNDNLLHDNPYYGDADVETQRTQYESARDAFYALSILSEPIEGDTTVDQTTLDGINTTIQAYYDYMNLFDQELDKFFTNQTNSVKITGLGIYIGDLQTGYDPEDVGAYSGPNSRLKAQALQFRYGDDVRVEVADTATFIKKPTLQTETTIETKVNLPDYITIGDMLIQKNENGMNINFV
jgi:hypothetical protein